MMARQFFLPAGVLAFLLAFFTSSLVLTAQDGLVINRIAGKAEILEQGRRSPARTGQRLLAGQSVQIVGGGEVQMSTSGGRI
jgi:hypothetical protein